MLEFSGVHDKYKAFRDLNKVLFALVEKHNKIELHLEEKQIQEDKVASSSKQYDKGRPKEKDDFKSYEYTEYLRNVDDYNRNSPYYKLYISSSMRVQTLKDKIRKENESINSLIKSENYRKLLLKTYGYKNRKTGINFLIVLQKKTNMLMDLYKEQCKIVSAHIKQYDLKRMVTATGKMLSSQHGLNTENEYTKFHELKCQQLKIIKMNKRILYDRYIVNKNTISLIMSGHLDSLLRE